jgi:phasin family protein
MTVSTIPEQFVAARNSAFDSALSLVNFAVNSSEKLIALNIDTTREELAGSLEVGKHLGLARDVNAVAVLPGSLLQPRIDQLITYWRSVHELSAATQEGWRTLLDEQHQELNRSVDALLDWHGRFGGTSELAVAAARSAFAASSSAYQNVNKAAHHLAGIADASVSALGSASAAASAVASSPALKKKAA